MNQKAKYKEFCEKHYIPLMLRPFWLDAVSGEMGWDVCLATDQGGEVTGSLVYQLSNYQCFTIVKMPPLTDYSGLWLHYPENQEKNSSRYAFEKEVCNSLIVQLPKTAFFYQQWHPAISNWLPFYWQGFRQTTLYTYRLNLTHANQLFANFKAATRTHIRKAEKELTVEKSNDLAALYELIKLSFQRQQLRPYFSYDILQRLDKELIKSNLRTIYLVRDHNKKLHAGAYITWDEQCAYYLLSGADPTLRDSSAMYLLLWQVIQDQIDRVSTLDFMGSILEPVERVFRSFGGALTPHFKITKASNKFFYLLGILLNKEV